MSENRTHNTTNDIESQINLLKKKKDRLVRRIKIKENAENARETTRKARTRRLIETGALTEKYLETKGMTPERTEKLLSEIVRVPDVKKLLSVSETSLEETQ
jgi:hypothetical protein